MATTGHPLATANTSSKPRDAELKDLPLHSSITIPSDALQFCIDIGKKRYETNRKAGVKEQKYTMHKSGVDLSVQGVIGEWGILELFGLPKDALLDTSPNSMWRDRGDMTYCGAKVDIKCPEGHHCGLQARAVNAQSPSAIYALCTMERVKGNGPSSTTSTTTTTTPPADEKSGQQTDPECVCTFSSNDKIEVIYRGCVAAKNLFCAKNRKTVYGKPYFYVSQRALKTLQGAYNEQQSQSQQPNPPSAESVLAACIPVHSTANPFASMFGLPLKNK